MKFLRKGTAHLSMNTHPAQASAWLPKLILLKEIAKRYVTETYSSVSQIEIKPLADARSLYTFFLSY
jgi:hypothetical protein